MQNYEKIEKNGYKKRLRERHDKAWMADERGWEGQYGQRPGSREEDEYRPNAQPANPQTAE